MYPSCFLLLHVAFDNVSTRRVRNRLRMLLDPCLPGCVPGDGIFPSNDTSRQFTKRPVGADKHRLTSCFAIFVCVPMVDCFSCRVLLLGSRGAGARYQGLSFLVSLCALDPMPFRCPILPMEVACQPNSYTRSSKPGSLFRKPIHVSLALAHMGEQKNWKVMSYQMFL